MSFQAAVKTLSPRVRDLVLAVTQNGERHVGETDKDREEVSSWMEKTSQGEITGNAKFQVCCITIRKIF
jgi:aminoacyl tRNA synthase complex-interacting multifunctional protein 1